MGYYDQDYIQNDNQKKGGKGKPFFYGLVGAIIGGVLVISSGPLLSQFDNGTGNNASSITSDENGETTVEEVKTLNVDVNSSVTEAVEKVSDAVVGVSNIQEQSFWDQTQQTTSGTGSGVVYKTQGDKAYIVTNNHVVEGASQLEIIIGDDEHIPAELIGTDALTDLAVVTVDASRVSTVAEFANSDSVKTGETVLAIGNPLGLDFAGSVTQGIISGTERAIPVDINGDGTYDWQAEVMQTDAAINPGNSGGALVNLDGKVIGINSMKIAESAVEGIGLAIPTSIVEPVIADLEEFGEVKRPYMGLGLQSLGDISSYHYQNTLFLPEDVKQGVVVMSVELNSPASNAGLQEKDVIVEINGEPTDNVIDLRKQLYKNDIGDTIEVNYYREGELQTTSMKLAEQAY
ncbi:S1C family serine protease [Bacillus carboniphilus]|uniref:S1C family serine protease n=1 Tax=Bacillus carboniphilus TaxID=86663 RepID=A0ABY9JSY8_9BACI|nr:S1C family serine protease [Bacillus carboniphilus]WLR41858.1 S1C family serine protease [Bacillus carboniphilus]